MLSVGKMKWKDRVHRGLFKFMQHQKLNAVCCIKYSLVIFADVSSFLQGFHYSLGDKHHEHYYEEDNHSKNFSR